MTINFKTINIFFIICLMITGVGPLKAQTNDFSKSLNSYSFDLYRETKVENENLFISPLSTYYALLVAYEGSKNKTKQEFEKVLYLKNSGSLNNDYLHNITGKTDSCSGLKVSNAIWLDKNLKADEAYRKSVSNKYFSDFKQTEFANKDLAISAINSWVSEKTKRKINEIVNEGNLDASAKLLISNAVYFKGEWLTKFDKQKTISATFFTSAENQCKVDFMNSMESLPYYENDEYQFISRPYRDSDLSFAIVLPKKLFGIEAIEKEMNKDFLSQILDSAYSTQTGLSIPKLILESSCELSAALKKAGLKTAFNSEADFSGISEEAPLMLGQVWHKAWIELDEEKTEAATATAAVVRITGMPSYRIFKADHPFVFFVIDNRSGAILFMGRYIKPAHGEAIEKECRALNLEKRIKEKFAVGKEGNVLIVLDKKIISQSEIQNINPDDIESINVLKDKEEIAKYSSKNYDGIIIVTLKKKRHKKRKYE